MQPLQFAATAAVGQSGGNSNVPCEDKVARAGSDPQGTARAQGGGQAAAAAIRCGGAAPAVQEQLAATHRITRVRGFLFERQRWG